MKAYYKLDALKARSFLFCGAAEGAFFAMYDFIHESTPFSLLTNEEMERRLMDELYYVAYDCVVHKGK